MKKLILLCLAATGLAGLPLASADAHEALPPAIAPAANAVNALPATARVNLTVVVGEGRRHYRNRRYRTVRRVTYRHGRRIVVYRRSYY